MNERPLEPDPEVSSFADKLDGLFKTITKPGGGEYSYEEVAAQIRQRTGTSISAPYLWQLRRGKRDNPTLRHIQALETFFGVPAGYFLNADVARAVEPQLRLLGAMRDARIRSIATRAFEGNLSPQALNALSDLLDSLLEMRPQPLQQRRRPTKSEPATEE